MCLKHFSVFNGPGAFAQCFTVTADTALSPGFSASRGSRGGDTLMYIHHDSLLTAQGRGEKKSQSCRDVFLRVPGHISQELLSLNRPQKATLLSSSCTICPSSSSVILTQEKYYSVLWIPDVDTSVQSNKSLWHLQNLPPARGKGETYGHAKRTDVWNVWTSETYGSVKLNPHRGINCLPAFRSSDRWTCPRRKLCSDSSWDNSLILVTAPANNFIPQSLCFSKEVSSLTPKFPPLSRQAAGTTYWDNKLRR